MGIWSGGERGQPALLSIVGPGEMFGEMAVLSGVHERTASARTFDRVETLQIHGAEVQALRRTHPGLNEVFLDVLLRRVIRLTTQVAELSELDGQTRLFRQLCRLGEVFGNSVGEIPITQQQLASLSGVGLRITSRVLSEARGDGVIETAKSKITVLDWPAVRRRAGWRAGH